MRRSLVRGLIVAGVGLAAMIVLVLTTSRPALHPVVVVTQPIAAGSVLSAADLGTMDVVNVPSGVVTSPGSVVGKYAQAALYPGETLPQDAVGAGYGLGKGLVEVVVPVSAAQSGLVFTGDWVDVIGEQTSTAQGATATVTPIVSHVLVTGVYTSSGAAVTQQSLAASSSSSTAPSLVALAVTPSQAETITSYAGQTNDSVWLVFDPGHVGFNSEIPPTTSSSTVGSPSGPSGSTASTIK